MINRTVVPTTGAPGQLAGLSPFRETGTAFAARLLYVLLAGGYAIGMLALVEPLRPRSEQ